MKQIWRDIILEWQKMPLPTIYPRETDLSGYLDLAVKKIVTLTGFRRSGKTFLLFDLVKKLGRENTLYINFEDERIKRETKSLTSIADAILENYGKKKLYLLLDEIQNIPGWSLWLRRLQDTTNHQILISGSSSKLFSSELPTELGGRTLPVYISPLNFREFLNFKREIWEELTGPMQDNLLREFLTFGGLPEIVLQDAGKKHLVMEEYFKTFVLSDIVLRYKIRNKESLRLLINLLLNSTYLTVSKLANSIKSLEQSTGKATIARYLTYFTGSFFCDLVYAHTPSLKKREKAEKKVYFIDNFFITKYAGGFSKNWGRLLEGAVYQKLKSAGGGQIYYFKDYQGREADFVIRNEEGVRKILQVSYLENENEMNKREVEGLLRGMAAFSLKKGTLVTWGVEKTLKIEGKEIEMVPLGKFLKSA